MWWSGGNVRNSKKLQLGVYGEGSLPEAEFVLYIQIINFKARWKYITKSDHEILFLHVIAGTVRDKNVVVFLEQAMWYLWRIINNF